MDYEKAYKAVLKTATQWIKDGCTDKEKICLECVFPELRESEDARIKKWLIDYFGSIKKTVWIHRDITCEQILGWLEKQKEQKPNIEICPHSIKSKSYSMQKEQKPADKEQDSIAFLEQHGYTIVPPHAPVSIVPSSEATFTEWSEEDEKRVKEAIKRIDELAFSGIPCNNVREVLQSLRPSWKPSEEQMEALERASTNKYLSAKQFDILVSLYEQLKKL